METKACYLCGSTENLTKDHVPPKNIFIKPHPTDLITISCCESCNNGFALIDEVFRAFVSLSINRSKKGSWIWENKVMGSTFKRSPKLKVSMANNLFQMGSQTAIKMDTKKVDKYIIRLTKGLISTIYPNVDYTVSKFEVHQTNVDANVLKVLKQSYYFEKGDGTFRCWRMLASDCSTMIWIYSFYDVVPLFTVYIKGWGGNL